MHPSDEQVGRLQVAVDHHRPAAEQPQQQWARGRRKMLWLNWRQMIACLDTSSGDLTIICRTYFMPNTLSHPPLSRQQNHRNRYFCINARLRWCRCEAAHSRRWR